MFPARTKLGRILSSDLSAVLFLLAMVLWFLHELVWMGKVPFFRDLATYHYANRFILARSFELGEIPLWSRQISMGFPFAANPSAGAFYPPHVIFILLPFFIAIRFLFVFHYLIAAAGSYFLCRHWNYPPYVALIGAMLFTFGGAIVSLSNMMDHFQSAVWLPWILLWGERAIRSQSWNDFFPLTLLMFVQVLAGYPETYLMTTGLLFLDAVRIKAEGVRISYAKLLVLLLAVNMVVAGLAMVQLLPAWELFLQSTRSEGLPYAKAIAWSLRPLSLLNFFFLDKEVDLELFNGLHLFLGREPPLLVSLYMGAITLCALFAWWFTASVRERFVLFALSLLVLTLALGSHTPLYSLFLSFMPFFRFPEKLLLPFYLFLVFAALRGLHRYLELPSPTWRPLLAMASVVLVVSLVYIVLRLDRGILVQFVSWAKQLPAQVEETLGSLPAIIVSLERQILLFLAVSLLIVLWKKGSLRPSLFQPLLVALVFFDLSSAHRAYHFFSSPDQVLRRRPIFSAPDEPYRLLYIFDLSDLHPNTYAFHKRQFTEIVSATFASLVPNAGVFHGFDYLQELDALKRRPYSLFLEVANELPADRLYRLLGALNVKYITSFGRLPDGEIRLVRYFEEYPSWLYQLERVTPRAYIVSRAVKEKDPTKVVDRLSRAEFDPFKEVMVDRALAVPAGSGFQGRAEIVQYADQRVSVRASLNGAGVLVLADSFYPGWRVYVDGREGEIFRANFFFRGVSLPAGEHVVEFRYQPRSFKIGLAISLATLCVLLVFFFAHLALNRRHQRSLTL